MKDGAGSVRTVVVLGGGSEIGGATVRRLVADGARTVVLAGRDPGALPARAVAEAGAERVETVAFDALDPGSHAAAVSRCWDAVGEDVDLVLVAFGVLGDEERGLEDAAAAVQVAQANYVGAVSAMVTALGRLRAQGHGTFVVLSSVAAERVRGDNPIYGSSKAGLDAFAQGLADRVVDDGVRVLVVRPGFVHTQMTEGRKPAPFSTTPEVVADAIARGLARGDHTVWAPGKLRYVMAVLRHLPRPLFRRLSA